MNLLEHAIRSWADAFAAHDWTLAYRWLDVAFILTGADLQAEPSPERRGGPIDQSERRERR